MDSDRAKSPEDTSMISFQPPLPEWILDIPEDLDVWIAQRNFTEAVNQYESFQEFVDSQQLSSSLKDIRYEKQLHKYASLRPASRFGKKVV